MLLREKAGVCSEQNEGPILVYKIETVGKVYISQILGFGDYYGKKYVAQIHRNVNSKRRGFSFSKNF